MSISLGTFNHILTPRFHVILKSQLLANFHLSDFDCAIQDGLTKITFNVVRQKKIILEKTLPIASSRAVRGHCKIMIQYDKG